MAKLNIPLLKRLRTRFLRMRHRKHFDMHSFADKNECGTSMCIAGHAMDLQGYKLKFNTWGEGEFYRPSGRKVMGHMSEGARLLGLPVHDARILFTDMDIKTPKQAVERIEHLIETGEV